MIFQDYPYFSSTGDQAKKRLTQLALDLAKYGQNHSSKFMIEIGSNDGFLLSKMMEQDWRVLGIDPSTQAAKIAEINGVNNICEFFSEDLAAEILRSYGTPDLIIANNVLAHTDQMQNIFRGISILMSSDTTLIMEFSYLADIFQNLVFDTIYHEHMSYHSLLPLSQFLSKFQLTIIRVENLDVHGGSLRLYIMRTSENLEIDRSVNNAMIIERGLELNQEKSWKEFSKKISDLKKELNELLNTLVNEGRSIVGYGVPAKFTTFFHGMELKSNIFQFLTDDNPMKIGRFAPGTNLEIHNPSVLYKNQPDYIFLFSWNYSESIVKKIKDNKLAKYGVIVPLPELKIYSI